VISHNRTYPQKGILLSQPLTPTPLLVVGRLNLPPWLPLVASPRMAIFQSKTAIAMQIHRDSQRPSDIVHSPPYQRPTPNNRTWACPQHRDTTTTSKSCEGGTLLSYPYSTSSVMSVCIIIMEKSGRSRVLRVACFFMNGEFRRGFSFRV
jgi:hypothetical protein